MKIEISATRECCAVEDLKPIEGTPKRGYDPVWMFCVHCGRHHLGGTQLDAAGDSDWVYTRVDAPWQEAPRHE